MKDDGQKAVGPTRPRGRPRVPDRRGTVSTWVPVAMHDRLIQLASQHDESVSATVRRLIVMRLK